MNAHDLRSSICLCPWCGHELSGATNLPGETNKPRPGDISICVYCGKPLRFGRGLIVEQLSQGAIERLHPQERQQLNRVMLTWAAMGPLPRRDRGDGHA